MQDAVCRILDGKRKTKKMNYKTFYYFKPISDYALKIED